MKTVSGTKLIWQWNGKNSPVFLLFLPAGLPIKSLIAEFIKEFNEALKLGVNNIDAVVEKFGETGIITGIVLKNYLTENIDYNFDDDKKKGLKLFLDLLGKL